MTTENESVTYRQTVSEQVGASEVADWVSTFQPVNPWPGMIGFATDLDTYEFRIGAAWRHPAWTEGATFTGPVSFFRFGYGATVPLVKMQSAGTDATGSGQQVLSVSHQVTHSGAGYAGAIGAVYSASTIDGAPYTDYYAAAFTMTNRALRLSGATADEAQHGTLFTHQVKDRPSGFTPGVDVLSDSWVQWWVMQDRTNLPSSQGGALVGVEFDIFGNNQDDAVGKKRYARQVVLNNYAKDASKPLEWGYLDYFNSFTGGINDTFFNVVSAYYAGWTVAGIDMSQGTGSRSNPYIDGVNRGVAIKFADGVKFGWSGDGATGFYTTHGSSRLQFWNAGAEVASISDTGVGIFGTGAGSAPVTITSGIISVPASQSLSLRVATAGQTISLGAPAAGLGQVITATPNSNGNSLFGAAPNTATVTNLMTAGRYSTTGGTYALSGTVTPTAFSGTGATATATFLPITGIVIPVGSTITITGVTPAGYNTTAATVTASTITTVSWASTATGTLSVAGSLAYNIAAPRIVNIQSNWTGTPAAGTQFYPYIFNVPTDETDTGPSGFGAPIFLISHNFGGNAKGSKNGIRVLTTQTSATNDPVVPGVINQQHGMAEFWGVASANAGGTGTGALAAGNFYGTNPQILIQPGATYWRLANALGEVNLAAYASSNTITLGGTVTAGDTLSIQFTSADIVGSPVTVSWTTGASQTLAMVANNLVTAIMSNAALTNAKVSATRTGNIVKVYWYTHLAALTITPSVSGGATETMTLGSAVPGGSVDIKLMGSMIRLAEDTAPGTTNSAFLLFGAQPGSGTSGLFNYGLVFGGLTGYNGEWSWHAGSTLIGTGLSNNYGGSGQTSPLIPNQARYGIDFKNIAFAGNGGGAMRWSGGSISDTGGLFVGGYKIAADSAGLKLDTSTGATATSVALASGGGGGAGVAAGNYFIGDVGFDDYGGVYRVATVNTSTGAVVTFTTLVSPSYTSGGAPANPLTVSGGSGAGWTVTVTWPAAPKLYLQNAGGGIMMPALQASTTYANDAAAAIGGVAVGQLYRNGSVVQLRIV